MLVQESEQKKNKSKKLPDKRSQISLIPKKCHPSLKSPIAKLKLTQPKLSHIILRSLSYNQGFHFYKIFGQYTGITATSLNEFYSKLKIIDQQSVLFHYLRGDFQKWIRNTLKDQELANQIDQIQLDATLENIREKILILINNRLKELQKQIGKMKSKKIK